MIIITINLSEPNVAALKTLQDLGIYSSRSEAIRVAIRDYLQEIYHPDPENTEKHEGIERFAEKKRKFDHLLKKLQDEEKELGRIRD
jgi:Arc/MetJ-type ribon-helix-helix transcriptional regulator